MNRNTLNLAAAVLCGIGSIATLADASSKRAVLSGLFGIIGSAAWAASAYQDLCDERDAVDAVAI